MDISSVQSEAHQMNKISSHLDMGSNASEIEVKQPRSHADRVATNAIEVKKERFRDSGKERLRELIACTCNEATHVNEVATKKPSKMVTGRMWPPLLRRYAPAIAKLSQENRQELLRVVLTILRYPLSMTNRLTILTSELDRRGIGFARERSQP